MEYFRRPPGSSEYTFHFSRNGFDALRALASQYGERSTESMLRLIAITLHREGRPVFKKCDYSVHDIKVTQHIGLSDFIHARLLSLADANGVPRECLGDLLTNYVVRQ